MLVDITGVVVVVGCGVVVVGGGVVVFVVVLVVVVEVVLGVVWCLGYAIGRTTLKSETEYKFTCCN